MTPTTATSRSRPCPPAARARNRRAGFTLIELAVALTIILLIVTMVVPTLTKMLTSRAAMEAFNLVAAQLSAARAEAVAANSFAGIHIQLNDDPDEDLKIAYSMILQYNNTKAKFERHELFIPQELPGGTAMGELSETFINGNTSKYQRLNTDSNIRDFCAFSVIFSAEGAVVTKVKGSNIMFDPGAAMFSGSKTTKLWDIADADGEPGIMAFTMFDYLELRKRTSAERGTYLDENGQFMPVNMHTGQLFDRQ